MQVLIAKKLQEQKTSSETFKYEKEHAQHTELGNNTIWSVKEKKGNNSSKYRNCTMSYSLRLSGSIHCIKM